MMLLRQSVKSEKSCIHTKHSQYQGQIFSVAYCSHSKYEPPHDKTNKMACAPSEDSDQPGHPVWLKSTVCMKKAWVLSRPLSALHSKDSAQRKYLTWSSAIPLLHKENTWPEVPQFLFCTRKILDLKFWKSAAVQGKYLTWSSAIPLPHKENTWPEVLKFRCRTRKILDLKFRNTASTQGKYFTWSSEIPLPYKENTWPEVPQYRFHTRKIFYLKFWNSAPVQGKCLTWSSAIPLPYKENTWPEVPQFRSRTRKTLDLKFRS